MKKFQILLLFFSCFLLLGSNTYQPLADKSFLSARGIAQVEGFDVDYVIKYNNSTYSNDWIASHLTDTSEKLVEFAKSNKYRIQECRPVHNLDIFIVDMETLNDRDRFNEYEDPNSRIWALFDKTRTDHNRASIILTDHGSYNSILFAHELAHYWAYRFCWDFYHTEVGGEDIAVSFEKFYRGQN